MKKGIRLIAGLMVATSALVIGACTVNRNHIVTEDNNGDNMTSKETDISAGVEGDKNSSEESETDTFSSASLDDDIKLSDYKVPDEDAGKQDDEDELIVEPYYGCPVSDSIDAVKPETE